MRTKPTPTATYVFCLVQSARTPSIRGVPESVPGAGGPRVLPINGDLWAIVADAPLERFSSDRLQEDLQDLEAVSRHALAHAAVVEFFFRKAPVIPLKLFTLFSEDARAREYLLGRAAALRKLFGELRGVEEWGVRVVVDPSAGGFVPSQRTPAGISARPSGKQYLQTKKRLLNQSGGAMRAAAKHAKAALKSLEAHATRVRHQSLPAPAANRPFVAGASFLVTAKGRAAWKKHVASVASALATHGHRLEVNGPWPPYHFASPGK
jgi:hypothetical protein